MTHVARRSVPGSMLRPANPELLNAGAMEPPPFDPSLDPRRQSASDPRRSSPPSLLVHSLYCLLPYGLWI